MHLSEKEWFIEAPWGRIAIIAWGNCLDPPVLLCHGAVDSAVSFRPLIALLPKKFYYIGMEIPGNGKSDRFPPGMMINAYDVVYAIQVVVKHFRWEHFVFIAHSTGTLLGKIYNLAYPGKMSKVVELDPTPTAYVVSSTEFADWYHKYFTSYFDKYEKYNGSKETTPTYTREKAVTMLKNHRGMPEDKVNMILDRISEPVGNNSIRFTFDQRTKLITQPSFPLSYVQKIYTNIQTPTLIIAADLAVNAGYYNCAPFILKEKSYPAFNCRIREVKGNHYVHIIHPDRVAPFISQFLLNGLEGIDSKAKL